MKAQSFEHQLRNAVAPAPDTEARLRARRAALAEFAKVHGQQDAGAERVIAPALASAAAPAADASGVSGTSGPASVADDASARSRTAARPDRRSDSFWPLGWPLKSAWLGGMATACIVVLGVSVVWLMPPQDRDIKFQLQYTPEAAKSEAPGAVAPSESAATLPTPAGTTPPPAREVTPVASADTQSTANGASAQPSFAQTAAVDGNAAGPARSDAGAAADADASSAAQADSVAPANTRPGTLPFAGPTSPRASGTASSPTAADNSAAAAEPSALAPNEQPAPKPDELVLLSPDERRQLALSREGRAREVPRQDVTDRPVPAAPPSAGAASENDAGRLDEVVVTGARKRRNEVLNSPIAAVAEEPAQELQKSVVTSTRSKRRFFSKKPVPASYPVAPSPAAAPDEGRDKFQHFETNPVKRTADDPVSTFSVDVDTAAYSFVRRKLTEGVMPQMDAVRVEEMINYFDYNWPTSDSRDQPFKPTIAVSDSPWGKGKKLIHIGIKGYALPPSQQPDVNLVLLLDVSGSMASPDKLPLAQRSMALLLDSLRPTDTVAIVVYAGAVGQVLPPTRVSDKETILHALNRLEPGGSTAGAEGIQLAYALAEKSFRKGGVNRILLATDGDFNVGITDQNELKSFVAREREKGVYLSVLGFGEGNYRDEMAQTLAQNGNGVAAYIDTLNEAKKVLVQEATSSLFPIAKDVKLQVEFNPATVAEYRLVGYETRALNREDFNNDKVDAGDVGSGHTVTAIYEITPVGSDAKLIDERRYAAREERSERGKANEYGFLKIRYKLPNGLRSRLLEQPIQMDAGVPAALKDDVSFSTAVAGFGQLLRGSQYVGALSFEDVIKQAQAGIGADPFGYRAEFVRLVSKAQQARGM